MSKKRLTIATRESPLALRQAELVKAALLKMYPGLSIELLGITTQGDKRLDVVLTDIGGKGLFVKELEDALLDGRADLAVHSMKDVTMNLPDGLSIPVISKREDPRDVFISNEYSSLADLPAFAKVGTSSLRRQAQLQILRRDLDFKHLRGNVNTRLKRLDELEFHAIVLAAAGLKRMQLAHRIRCYLSLEESLPAAGQGAIGIECRENDRATRDLIMPLNHLHTHACVDAERAVCRQLNGGCKVPIAAFAEIHPRGLILNTLIASKDGKRTIRARGEGKLEEAEKIGIKAAEELIKQGAEEILQEFLQK